MITLYIIFIGACLGSFINALVWRTHEQAKPRKKSASKPKINLSIISGRSVCPNCHHVLSAKDLVPILSWLQLRGKCRYCKVKFADSPLTELLTPILFVASYAYWPLGFSSDGIVLFILWLIFLVGLLALAIYDLRWFLLPNRIVYPLLWLAGLQVVFLVLRSQTPLTVVQETFFGVIIGGGLFYVLFQLSKGEWIGGGDVKLGFLIGAILGGPWQATLMIFLASLIGTLTSIPSLLNGKRKTSSHIPFGPYLILATFVVYLFGASIINWYKGLVNLS
jgi:prepilin signal peptidase PulO-like enzyme (type II secretory pathway)